MERRRGIGVDCSITRSSADYRRHMQMTRCCTIRNAHNETCSISQKVVQQLALCLTGSARASGHWRRVELTQSDVQSKRVAQSRCICIWRRSPKSFCPRTIAAHFPFGQIGPQIYVCLCFLYLGNLFVFP